MCTYVYEWGYVYMHEWAGLGFNGVIEVCFVCGKEGGCEGS